jgi:hypothetical protein
MKRRLRFAVLAGYLATGAIVMQLGPFCTIASSTTTAGIAQSGFLIDGSGNFLGLLPVCGTPDLLIGRESANNPADVIFDPIANTEDDLMFGCPVQVVIIPAPIDEGDG